MIQINRRITQNLFESIQVKGDKNVKNSEWNWNNDGYAMI